VEQLQDVEAIIVDGEGRVFVSTGLRNRVRLSMGLQEGKFGQ
jgi:hypothetical protein